MALVLTQLNATPGVIGSLVCDAKGFLVAHAFPPQYDAARLRAAARAVAERRPASRRRWGSWGRST